MSFQQIPPQHQKPVEEQREDRPIGAILLALAMILGYFGLRQMSGGTGGTGVFSAASQGPVGQGDVYEHRVNQHLHQVNMRRQLEQETMAVENQLKAPSLKHAEKEYAQYFEEWGVSLDQEGREHLVYEDIDPEGVNPSYLDTPHYDVQARIRANQIAEAEAQARLAMAKRVAIAKAAAEGYAIELNDDMVVTEVRKLRREPQSVGDFQAEKSGRSSVR